MPDMNTGAGVLPDEMPPQTDSPDDETDGMPDQNAEPSGTVDPLSMLKQALAHGRKLFNVAAEFGGSQDTQQSAAEGGQIEAEPDTQDDNGNPGMIGPGDKPVDPRDLTSYIVGEGGVKPEVASALEQAADPQGKMKPYDRMMAAIGQMKDPNAAFSYIQGKRRNAAGMIAAANAAMKRGNMAQAAHYATQAFSNIPNSGGVGFAPHANGLVTSAPQQQQQPQEQPEQPQQSAAGGGVIEADETNPSALYSQQTPGQQSSFEDGGEVPEYEDEDNSGEPKRGFREMLGDAIGMRGKEGQQEAQTAGAEGWGEAAAHILNPEQSRKLVNQAAFDQVADNGFSAWLKSTMGNIHDKGWISGIGHSVMGDAAEAGPATKQMDRTDPMAMAGDAVVSGVNAGMQGISDLNSAIGGGLRKFRDTLKPTPKQAAPAEPQLDPTGAGMMGGEDSDPLSPVTKGGKYMNPVSDPNRPDNNPLIDRSQIAKGSKELQDAGARRYTKDGKVPVGADGKPFKHDEDPEEARVSKREAMLDRLAMQRFPMLGGDRDRREAYKSELRKDLYAQDNASGKFHFDEKTKLADQAHANRMAQLTQREEGLNWRNQNSTATRYGIAQLQQMGKTLMQDRGDMMRAATKVLSDNPGMSPEDAMAKIAPLAKMYGFNDPKLLRDVAHGMLNPDLYKQGGQQQAAAPQEPAQQQGNTRPVKTYPKGPFAGKPVYVNPDGTVEPVK